MNNFYKNGLLDAIEFDNVIEFDFFDGLNFREDSALPMLLNGDTFFEAQTPPMNSTFEEQIQSPRPNDHQEQYDPNTFAEVFISPDPLNSHLKKEGYVHDTTSLTTGIGSLDNYRRSTNNVLSERGNSLQRITGDNQDLLGSLENYRWGTNKIVSERGISNPLQRIANGNNRYQNLSSLNLLKNDDLTENYNYHFEIRQDYPNRLKLQLKRFNQSQTARFTKLKEVTKDLPASEAEKIIQNFYENTSSFISSKMKDISEHLKRQQRPTAEENLDIAVNTVSSLSEEVLVAAKDVGGHGLPQRKKKQFSARQLQLLKTWFYENRNDPYPQEHQLKQLQKETNLERNQIKTWLSNARFRKLRRGGRFNASKKKYRKN